MFKFKSTLICALLWAVGLTPPSSPHNGLSTLQETGISEGYYVISNSVHGANRDIRALLGQRYFSEDQLLNLMSQLFRQYPEPDRIDIWLYSNIDQVRGFVAGQPYHPAELILDRDDPGRYDRYAHALLLRRDGNEVMRYHLPEYKEERLKTVVVKGKDPASSGR